MIRPATLKDLNDMYDIRIQAARRMKYMGIDQWQDEHPLKETFKEDILKKRAYVYEYHRQVLGTATFQISPEISYKSLVDITIPAITCHRIAVADKGLRQGIATQFMNYMEMLAKTKHIYVLYVDTHHDNMLMRHLLQRNKFTYIGDITLEHLRSKARMLYMKTLTF